LKTLLVIILCCSLNVSSLAQQDTLKQVALIKGDIIDFTIDNLGNIYLVNRDNQLKKINIKGDSLGVFNDIRQYGKVYSIDATNPLKVLLFYKDYGNIVVLDRYLNVRNTINLHKANVFQVSAISQSYDNGIWLYDPQEAKLKKLNDEGNIVDQSADFRLFLDAVPFPVQIVDQDRLVYLYDPEKGLYIFDYFGTLKNKVALLGWQDFQVVGGKVFGRKRNTLEQYQPGILSLKEQSLDHILGGVVKIKISLNNLYCLKDGVIKVYAY
jgi:hypothetical protein